MFLANSLFAESADEADVDGNIQEQYKTIIDGWFLDYECKVLSQDQLDEVEWHLYYIAEPISKIISESNIDLIKNNARKTAISEKFRNCSDKSKNIINSTINLSRQLNKLLNNKSYIKPEADKEYAISRYKSGAIAIRVIGYCPGYLDEKSRLEFKEIHELVKDKLMSLYGESFENHAISGSEKIKRRIAFPCSDNAKTHFIYGLKQLIALADDLDLNHEDKTYRFGSGKNYVILKSKRIKNLSKEMLKNSFRYEEDVIVKCFETDEKDCPDHIKRLSQEHKDKMRKDIECKSNRKPDCPPRRKYISASTREHKYAGYMEAWRAKIVRVGNLNYPKEARKQKLFGDVIIDTAINSDGTLNKVTIRRSSGHEILDNAAVKIVKLTAPFDPFPDSFKDEIDILHITRTWQYINQSCQKKTIKNGKIICSTP